MERIHQIQPAPEQRDLLTGLTVPADDSLAQQDDPAAALSSLLPLKGPTARRRETAKAIRRAPDGC
ncbi:hypothetical protein ACFU8W_47085 [Streptomyces sp. NPDC057565]|uniref:hypothetical protein n=1 Tax=Streptomyces sp. NPDC057565 TaxID=3346169 RepID=UPI00368FDEEE